MKNKPALPQAEAIEAAINSIKNKPLFEQAKYIIDELANSYVDDYFYDSIISGNKVEFKYKKVTDGNLEDLAQEFISFCYSESNIGFLLPRPQTIDYDVLKLVIVEYFWYRYFQTDNSCEYNLKQSKFNTQ